MATECLLCTKQLPDNDHSFGRFCEDTGKTCPEGLSAQRRKLTKHTKEHKADQCISLWSPDHGNGKTSQVMGSMRSSSNALPQPHLRRLRVAGDFNVDTLEGTAARASSLKKKRHGDRSIVTGKIRLAAVIINARSFNGPCTCHCRHQRRTSSMLLRPCLHE